MFTAETLVLLASGRAVPISSLQTGDTVLASDASDFGINGNYNPANRQAFQDALEGHLDDPGTSPIQGTYRGDPVTHYFNPGTGLNVIVNPAGEFVSGWRLGVAQITNILTHGGLN